ncbi:unnamed protein product [Vicia faba]|uniref:Uncharacterized protein n=1 Tax=Vicia faba TaxID=3906 RepID=A0AAV1AXZ7_VICFA|nr:unnamed protein product [Vicia faba]
MLRSHLSISSFHDQPAMPCQQNHHVMPCTKIDLNKYNKAAILSFSSLQNSHTQSSPNLQFPNLITNKPCINYPKLQSCINKESKKLIQKPYQNNIISITQTIALASQVFIQRSKLRLLQFNSIGFNHLRESNGEGDDSWYPYEFCTAVEILDKRKEVVPLISQKKKRG